METEFIRMGIVYLHLIACCVAIGTVFMGDLDMVRRLLRSGDDRSDPGHFDALHTTVSRALIALWVTGVALVGMDVLAKGTPILLNPKLQAKIAMVVLLTINGFALQQCVLPWLKKMRSLMGLTFSRRMLAVFVGSVSAVSWFYAALLGVGRPLNWQYSLAEILAAYPVMIAGGFFAMMILTAWADYRARHASLLDFQLFGSRDLRPVPALAAA
ncbi:hypothetical protein [Ramlibacter henchirensis]|uniref:hypothetical protein n=1 Tax=Ramlibacter henchirensis TaxID=204072 RepID=UPI001981B01A|nr:hypothetical protein [Ramlibacter henchirensis]